MQPQSTTAPYAPGVHECFPQGAPCLYSQDDSDANLIVVAAVEEYARRHSMETLDVLRLFEQKGILAAIRSQYAVLHTLDLDEACDFAEDLLC